MVDREDGKRIADNRRLAGEIVELIGRGGVQLWACGACRRVVNVLEHGRQCPKCGNELVRRSDSREEQVAFRKQHRIAQLERAWATVPEGFQWARLGAPEFQARVKVAEPAGHEALRHVRSRGSVTIVGPSGAGKTSLACALVRALIDEALRHVDEDVVHRAHRRAIGCAFMTAYALAKAGMYSALGSVPELIGRATHASVLVLDDLGTDVEIYRQSATSVREVLHERHAERRPTVVTTFLRRDDLVKHYGAGIARRLGEGLVVSLGADDAGAPPPEVPC